MARKAGPSIDRTYPQRLQQGYSYEGEPQGLMEVWDVLHGIQTSIPRSERAPGSFIEAKNVRTDDEADWIGRREGSTLLGSAPNSDAVLYLALVINEDGNVRIVRITKDTIYFSYGDGNWNSISSTLPNGTIHPIDATMLLGNLYIVNGSGKVIEIDLIGETASELSDSPSGATHIENYADRLVIAKGATLYWCANLDPTDWTNIGAGQELLAQGAGELANNITGLHAVGNNMTILRRNTIWETSRQPFADAPFRHTPVITNLGCDLPYSSVKIPGGIIFADGKTGSAFLYSRGSRPQKISGAVHKEFLHDLQDPTWVRGAYIPHHNFYALGLPSTSGSSWITDMWKFYITHNSWVHDEIPDASTLGSLYTDSVTFIDDLVGNIDALSGDIDDLSGDIELKILNMAFGAPDGEVAYYDADVDTDWDSSSFDAVLKSQDVAGLAQKRYFKKLGLDLDILRAGSVVLALSREDEDFRITKSKSFTTSDSPTQIFIKRTFKGDRLFWKLTISSGDIRLKAWWAFIMEGALK